MIRVLIVDDHPFVRSALGELLSATEGFRVVAECADGSEVAEAAARTHPDVVLMDLLMPRMSGLEAARALRASQPDVRVIVLTGSLSAVAAREALALGIEGFLLKGDDAEGSLTCQIRRVATGGTAWCAAAAAEQERRPPGTGDDEIGRPEPRRAAPGCRDRPPGREWRRG
jgi:DNA-binding NarL/FixJ family response regulator